MLEVNGQLGRRRAPVSPGARRPYLILQLRDVAGASPAPPAVAGTGRQLHGVRRVAHHLHRLDAGHLVRRQPQLVNIRSAARCIQEGDGADAAPRPSGAGSVLLQPGIRSFRRAVRIRSRCSDCGPPRVLGASRLPKGWPESMSRRDAGARHTL